MPNIAIARDPGALFSEKRTGAGRTVGFSFGKQSCVAEIVTVDAIHASLAACFSESCETRRTCYNTVMGKVHG
jgi:hypothetical protein